MQHGDFIHFIQKSISSVKSSLDWFVCSVESLNMWLFIACWKHQTCVEAILCCLQQRGQFSLLSSCLWSVEDKRLLASDNTGGDQFHRCTLTALFADSCDYELLVLAAPAFTNCSGKAFLHWGREGWRWRWRDGVRYLATWSHVAKTRSCLVFFFPLSFLFHSHSNTQPSLLHMSAHLFLHTASSISPPPSLADWSKDEHLTGVLQSVLRKTVFYPLFIHLSFHICHRLTLEIAFSFFFIIPSRSFSFYCESGWSLEYKLTGASSPKTFIFYSPLLSSPLLITCFWSQDSSNHGIPFNKT